ncbi:MAG: glycosyltransferase [Variovorax sp.]
MRILFFVHQFFPEYRSGTEAVTLNLAKAAQRAGHHVCVLSSVVTGAPADARAVDALPGAYASVFQGLPLVLLPRAAMPADADYALSSDEAMVAHLQRWLALQKFDLAHGLHPMRMASVLRALIACDIPYVLTLTDFFYECTRINLIDLAGHSCPGPDGGMRCASICKTEELGEAFFLERHAKGHEFLRGARKRIAPSPFVADRYRQAFPDLPFDVIAHGVDLIELAALGGEPGRESQADESRPLRLLYAGTMIEPKGAEMLLQALALVPDANVRLRLAGGYYGNEAFRATINLLLAADARAEWIGELARSDLARELSNADVLCLPSLVPETFSLIFHEAAAVGLPALVSSLGAPAEVVAASGAGRVVECGNARAWADAIADLAACPSQRALWAEHLPLPLRIEEEAFFYQSIYLAMLSGGGSVGQSVTPTLVRSGGG